MDTEKRLAALERRLVELADAMVRRSGEVQATQAALERGIERQQKQIAGLVFLLDRRQGEIYAAHAALGMLIEALPDRETARRDLDAAFNVFIGMFMADPNTSEAMLEGFYGQEKRLRGKLRSSEAPEGPD